MNEKMKGLYLDCQMGAAGDMLLAALLELCPDQVKALNQLNQLGIPKVKFYAQESEKCGIFGTHVRVTADGGEEESQDVHSHEHGHAHQHRHEHSQESHDVHHSPHAHHHSGIGEIRQIISNLSVSETVKEHVYAVYQLIAEAESQVHHQTVEEIHFHEVGTLDAVADITGVCFLMEELGIEAVYASPVHVGSGQVHCAHGILPVPAPATALLLQGIPTYSKDIQGELCTPTGAALLKHFVCQFGQMPLMTAEKIGYGMGKKDFEAANCVRAFLGKIKGKISVQADSEEVEELRCNLDDMNGEEIGYASEVLFREGALDVYTVGVGMKKSRPGILLVCLCRKSDSRRMEELIFRHTTTLGIRRVNCQRSVLARRMEEVETPWGKVRKRSPVFQERRRSFGKRWNIRT